MQIGRKKEVSTNQDHRNKKTDPNYYNYNSTAHKKWRKKVAEKSNWLCVHCLDPSIQNKNGTVSKQIHPGKIADHIKPIKAGGAPLDVDNGQFLCRYHDSKKSVTDKEYYR